MNQHRENRTDARGIIFTAIGLVALLAVAMSSAIGVVVWLGGQARGPEAAVPETILARPQIGPGVMPNQALGREEREAQQKKVLNQYAWRSDSDAVATIPIDRAMEILAERNLDTSWFQQEAEK